MSVQSVTRAFSLLEAIGDGPATLTELAKKVDLPVSTASRLLSTLEDMGAIERMEQSGSFRIGTSIVKMASTVEASSTLVALARPELEHLARLVDEATGVSMSTGTTMTFLDQVEADRAVQVRDWVGARLPMHVVASGLVVMASWTAEAVDRYLERELEGMTPQTVTDPSRIRQRLVEAHSAGVAWVADEFEAGLTSVAAPVYNGMGEVVCAVYVDGPTYRFPGANATAIETEVRLAADRISQQLYS